MARKKFPDSRINVVGMDPSMTNWGYAAATLCLKTDTITPYDIQLVITKPSNSKKIRKNIQDLNRFRILHQGMLRYLDEHKPDLIFVEMPHGSQSASAMKSFACCVTLLATVETPMITLTADNLKKVVSSQKKVPKSEMMDYAAGKYPDLDWHLNNNTGNLQNDNEHMADALIAIEAGINDDEYKNLKALSRTFGRN